MHATRKRRITTLVATLAFAGAGVATSLALALPASAATICEQYGTVTAGNYIIMNNRWGSTETQCISTTSNGFSIIQQDGTGNLSGAPVSYPAIYMGCHYGNCSPNSPLPAQISSMGSVPSTISMSYISSGTWDAAYDIWLNANTDTSGVQDTEIMIWMAHQGSIQPVGSSTGSANLAGRNWTVWTGNNGQNNVVSYVSNTAISSMSFNIRDFVLDAISRGSNYGNTSWYLTSAQAGFEPWIGGVGLAVNSFSVSVSGGPVTQTTSPPVQVPGTPGTPTFSNVTSNSLTVNWAASSGSVSQYAIERCQGSYCSNFSQVGVWTGTSYNDSGLSANTTYRYRVRAQNSAGYSSYSGIGTVTTTGGTTSSPPTTTTPPPGGGACSAAYSQVNSWPGGFQGEVKVTAGSSAISGWRVVLTFPNGQTITQLWSGNLSGSGPYTVTNMSWNGSIPAGGSTAFGFLGSWSGTNNPPTATCTVT